jgi:chemotaxis protein CheX
VIPDEAAIRSVVHTVWSTQLGLEPELDPAAPVRIGSPSMTAAVHISGDFSGVVRVAADRRLVRRAAAIMFSIAEDAITADDDRDTLGELANIVAGNIKALLPGTSSISLPTIIGGTDYTVSTVDVRSSSEVGFLVDGDAFVVTIVEHTARS